MRCKKKRQTYKAKEKKTHSSYMLHKLFREFREKGCKYIATLPLCCVL